MTIKLKPCPFCGSKKIIVKQMRHIPATIHFFECDGCGAVVSFRAPDISNLPEPINIFDFWNRRVKEVDNDHD